MAIPTWRRIVNASEQRVAGPLEKLVRHDGFGMALTFTSRGLSFVRTTAERNSRRILHAANLPAASDVNRLLEHLARVEREVTALNAAAAGSDRRSPQRPRASVKTNGTGSRAQGPRE